MERLAKLVRGVRNVKLAGLVLAGAVFVPCFPAFAQCSAQWFAMDGVSGAAAPNADACVAWDPDGPGPKGQVLVVGGTFSTVGEVLAENVAIWDGTAWSALGSGIVGQVDALAVMGDGRLVAAGLFTDAGGVPVNNIAAWDGTSWSALGTGVNNQVWSLAVSPTTGDLYAAGMFSVAGGVTANRVARWDGSAWSSLGTGSANGVGNAAYSVAVLPNNNVIVGGSFTSSGGVTNRRYIAGFDGSAWYSLGTGLGNTVLTVCAMPNGDVIAGGLFSAGGRIARWNGSAWSMLGTGLNFQPIGTIVLFNGDLVAAGHFTFAGGQPASKIARWDGASWYAMGIGMDQYVIGLAQMANGDLYAGGGFTTVDNMPTGYLARWATPVSARIATQPDPMATCPSGSGTFAVTASGSGPIAYQWEAELDPGVWTALADGTLSHNAVVLGNVSGATTSSLLIDSLTHFVEDRHVLGLRCAVSNTCGGTTSDPATLTVCPADFNCDGFIDPLDYNGYINAFEAGSMAADYNGDGFLDPLDYNGFINDFEAGC